MWTSRLVTEDGGPVISHAHYGPAVGGCQILGLLGACGVGEFTIGVIVGDEHPQGGGARRSGVLEHVDVAGRVARREDWSPTYPAPDPHRLHRAVVEELGLGRGEQGCVAVNEP